MADLEKVINGLECCILRDPDDKQRCSECPYEGNCVNRLKMDALSLLKAQKQEISRLKHHIDCDAAEKIPSGCVGYGRGFNDDEPCETCKQCPAYIGYDEE